MDPRRIQQTGVAGLAKRHKDNREIIDNTQTRSTLIDLPRFSCFRLAAQVIPDDTWTSVLFDYQETDEYEIQSDVGNADFIFTAETAGFWVIDTAVEFDTNDQQQREIRCLLNGATVLQQSQLAIAADAGKGGDGVFLQSNFMISINEGDALEVQVFQNSNNNRNLNHASFQGFRIGR